jgi:hypothetical protein
VNKGKGVADVGVVKGDYIMNKDEDRCQYGNDQKGFYVILANSYVGILLIYILCICKLRVFKPTCHLV